MLHEPPAGSLERPRAGSCKDIFFISVHDKLEELVEVMTTTAAEFEYPVTDVGVYLQPIVQAVNYHCEFNLFFDRDGRRGEGPRDSALRSRQQAAIGPRRLLLPTVRPVGEMAYGKDPATVAALRKVKNIFDPNNVMNPGKLCF